jgi:hypothetical protein
MENNPIKIHLKETIDQLVALGEDKVELDFWLSVFDLMNEEEQIKLFDNLSKELKKLKAIN